MDTITKTTGREIAEALRIAETRRARKRIARNLRESYNGKPLASDIRASMERGDWS